MTGIGFVGNRGLWAALVLHYLLCRRSLQVNLCVAAIFAWPTRIFSGRPVRLADRAAHQLGGEHRELAALRASLRP